MRFALAALVFAVVLRVTGGWAALRRLPRRVVLTGLGLGAVGYSLQSGSTSPPSTGSTSRWSRCCSTRIPRSSPWPRIALGRATGSLRTAVALAWLGRARARAAGRREPAASSSLGALLALGASLTYTTYILVSDADRSATVDPFALALLVLTGAIGQLRGRRPARPGRSTSRCPAEAWLWLVLIALVSTVVAVSAFFAGLRRVGPSEAAILSTFEPVVTVVLAFLVLGERLTPAQLAGGVLVLAAVVLLQLPARRRRVIGRMAEAPA